MFCVHKKTLHFYLHNNTFTTHDIRLPGAQGQLCQERTVTQPTGIVPGYSYRLSADDSYCLIGTSHLDSASHCFLQGRHCLSGQSFPEDAEPYDSGTSPVLRLGLLRMRSIQFWLKQRVLAVAWRHRHHRAMVTRAGVSALTHWRHTLWLKRGVTLDTAQRRKVVKTDASNKGWGALCGQTDLRSMVQGGIDPGHQLLRNASSMSGL